MSEIKRLIIEWFGTAGSFDVPERSVWMGHLRESYPHMYTRVSQTYFNSILGDPVDYEETFLRVLGKYFFGMGQEDDAIGLLLMCGVYVCDGIFQHLQTEFNCIVYFSLNKMRLGYLASEHFDYLLQHEYHRCIAYMIDWNVQPDTGMILRLCDAEAGKREYVVDQLVNRAHTFTALQEALNLPYEGVNVFHYIAVRIPRFGLALLSTCEVNVGLVNHSKYTILHKMCQRFNDHHDKDGLVELFNRLRQMGVQITLRFVNRHVDEPWNHRLLV